MMDKLTARLSARMNSPLPGLAAQLKMAGGLREKAESAYKWDESKVKVGAVLIALYPDNGVLRTVLMKRPNYDGTHSGQISFPGGKLEKFDNGIVEAALREAEEEVNIKPSEVKVIGQLTQLYIAPSNFLVYPILGILESRPNFIPDMHEVESIHTPELSFLFGAESVEEKEVLLNTGFKVHAPCFTVDGHTVWGATAMIISELREVFEGISLKP